MRQRTRRLLLTLCLVSLLLTQLVQPLLAAPAIVAPIADSAVVTAYGVDCNAGICTLRIKDAGLAVPGPVAAGAALLFTFLQEQIHLLPDGAGLQITNDVTLQTPMGQLALFDTDLLIELAADNTIERLRGTAQIPWPSVLGGAENAAQHALAMADIGLEPGKDLHHLNVPLMPEQPYFYMRLGAGLRTDADGVLERETLHAIDTPVTRGQYLTLLIDPQQWDLLIDGNLTVALLDDWLLLNEFLTEQTGLPFALASEAVNVHLSGLLSADWAASYVRLDGLYTLEKQFIRNWFQTDASPLAVTGSLLINQEGLLLSGLTRSSVLPDQIFDGALQVEAFLPLGRNFWAAYVATNSEAKLPLWAVQHAGEQQFSAALLQPFVNGAIARVEQTAAGVQPLFVVVKDTAHDAVVYAARGYQLTQDAATDGYQWTVATVVSGTTTATVLGQAGIASVQDLTAQSYQWTAAVMKSGAATTADLARAAYGWTAETTGSAVVTVGALAVDGYTVATGGMADHVDHLVTWIWPAE